jgi:DNA polymerase elongation subunit (family B)
MWLFDAYPVADGMAVWLLDEQGRARRRVEPFRPSIYVREPAAGAPSLWRTLRRWDVEPREAERIEFSSGRPVRVWQVQAPSPMGYLRLSRALQKLQDEVELFNADLPPAQMFFYERRLFPLARCEEEGEELRAVESPWDVDYELPPLKTAYLRPESGSVDPRHAGRPGRLLWTQDGSTLEIDGSGGGIETLRARLRRFDPDVLLTDWGDAFLIEALMAADPKLPLNRDEGPVESRGPRSYFSYGRMVYKAGWRMLRGRCHIDLQNSFILGEAGLRGLWELARMSRIPVQMMARTSTGTAITSMQLDEACRRGILIPWQKRTPEDFKTAEQLFAADKGGLVYAPRPGLYENVGEIDFASMFPSIMVRHNVSPETVNCPCCRPPKPSWRMAKEGVPGIDHWICRRRRGLVPEVLAPIVAKRAEFKRRFKETGDAAWKEKATGLKWVLVTCLEASTQVLVRRDGVIGVERIADSVARGASSLEVAGIDAWGRPQWKRVRGVVRTRRRGPIYRVRFSGGREVDATGDHLWPEISPGGWTSVRTDALKDDHWIPILEGLPQDGDVSRVLDLVEALRRGLPEEERWAWRLTGHPLKRAIASNWPAIRRAQKSRYASARTSWLWKKRGMIPLPFWRLLDVEMEGLRIGRGRVQGGRIAGVPARLRVDRDLGFFLGFFIADGSFGRNFVRLAVGEDERDLIPVLRRVARRAWDLPVRVYREPRARMKVLQINSVTLRRVLDIGLGIGAGADKLRVPRLLWRAPPEAVEGFLAGLAAGDGWVLPRRLSLGIATASRRFAHEIGFLMTRVGVSYRIARSRKMFAVQVRDDRGVRAFERFGPMSRKHRRRIRARRRARRLERYSEWPVRATGLRELAAAARSTRSPRVTRRETLSRADAARKLDQILDRADRLDPEQKKRARFLRKLVESPVTFARVRSVRALRRAPRDVYCFQLDGPEPWFAVQGSVLTHNCFGYLGYKNARFGRIEAHECVTALSREKLLQAKELAEARGFEVIHAIVDSIYLRRPGATREDFERLARAIGARTGVEAAVENLYDWIAFYPARGHAGWGVPNRFVGRAEREMKIRGVEARRHDLPLLVRRMQARMLERLARARTAAEYRAALPELREIFEACAERVRSGRATPEELAITRRLSRRPQEYRVNNATAAAARKLAARGAELMPGQSIRLVITDAASKIPSERAAPLGGEAVLSYDAGKYVEMLERALRTLESAAPEERRPAGQLLLPW